MEARKVLLAVLLCVDVVLAQNGQLKLSISTDGPYNISVGESEWFRSGPVKVRSQSAWLSTTDGSLILNGTYEYSASDYFGPYDCIHFEYHDKSGDFHFTTFIKTYTTVNALVFGHRFVSGAERTQLPSPDDVISSFPSIQVEDMSLQRGYLTYSGNMMEDVHIGQWQTKNSFQSGFSGGLPLAVFDKAMENTIVISPFREFMATSSHLDTTVYPHILQMGVFGRVDSVPKNYSVDFIMVGGDTVTNTFQEWGHMMRKYYGKDDSYRKSDFTINYLGYWTDNGACYWYTTAGFSNYEDAILAVKEQADKEGIPYRYLQIDSWWYYKGIGDGVKNWTAMPNIFTDGISGLSQKTGWPIMAHNRYWSPDTVYAEKNGGMFDFIIKPNTISLPTSQKFWDYLFSVSHAEGWNLIAYEQDWLHTTVDNLPELQTDVNLGRSWLMEMGNAAQNHDLTIQYCMPYPRHVMQSIEIPVVTQTRISDDYSPSNGQWIIGDTIIVAHALGLAGFKDTFHTMKTESGCHNTNDEEFPELETTVAAFSGGPVGPSDRYDLFNKTLIMATCMEDGLLLKPTRPAMSLDSTFTQRAFGEGGPSGQLWAGYTMLMDTLVWHFILAADITQEYTITTKDLPMFGSPANAGIVYQSLIGNGTVTYINRFDVNNTIQVPVCKREDFHTWTVAPIPGIYNYVVLGETSKFIKMSEQRILELVVGDIIIIRLRGAPGEEVTIAAIDAAKDITVENVEYYKCTVPDRGEVTLYIPSGRCE